MKITLLQTEIKWQDVQANILHADDAINMNLGSDLYILPEMWTTGCVMDPRGVAEKAMLQVTDGLGASTKVPESVAWMMEKARKVDAAICGSVAVESDGKFYNRHYFVKPDGEVTTYDKAHLFTFGGEGKFYTQGDRRVIVEWRGINILLEICYDLRFPMWSRNVINPNGKPVYDLVIYPANWPIARETAWETLSVARAIENECYVARVNCVGKDQWGEYKGKSALIHPYGHLVAECEDYKESEATGILDKQALDHYREKFSTLNDIVWTKNYY